MDSARLDRLRKTTRVRLAMEATETLKTVREELPGTPEGIGYFHAVLERAFVGAGDPGYADRPPRVGTFCVQLPEELVYAAGATPFRLCSGSYAYEQVGAEFLPAKACALVKASLGMLHAHPPEDIKLLVVPTTCDQKKKAAELLADLGYTVYSLEVPPSRDSDAARVYWHDAVRKLVGELQHATGQRITRTRLRDAIHRLARAREQFRRLQTSMEGHPPVLFGTDALLVANALPHADLEAWTDALERLNLELEERLRSNEGVASSHAPRLLFTGSPPLFPNLKLPLLVERAGAVLVADEVCSGSRFLYDAPAYAEGNLYDMLPAVADRCLKPSTCPFFSPNGSRIRKLAALAERFAIDGVVYQAFAGCHLYEMEHTTVGKALEERGIPMLYVETDYSPEDVGQLSTRVEAFVESVKARKKRGRA